MMNWRIGVVALVVAALVLTACSDDPVPTPIATTTPGPSDAAMTTPLPEPTASPTPTPSPVPTDTPTPVSSPSPTPSPVPTDTSTPVSSPTPTATTGIPSQSPATRDQQVKRGFSSDPGVLSPYVQPHPIDGAGRKLLAMYIVGSDLEDGLLHLEYGFREHDGLLLTDDLKELLKGYKALPDGGTVEVLVAFGGANKDGWRGMKFANISQLTDDARDGEFGNETGADAYLYRADDANMGDESSLTLFLDYLRDGYVNFDQRFLTFSDHGASYIGFGNDTNFNSDDLSMDEMARAFQNSDPGRFDLIGFDACNMASLEVAKVIEPHAQYMIASEAKEPGHGWFWTSVIEAYAQEDSILKAGERMVDDFVENPLHNVIRDPKTLSLLDLSEYDTLISALDPVVSALGDELLDNREYADALIDSAGERGAQEYAAGEAREGSRSRLSIDLMHFAQLLKERISDTELDANLEDLMNAVKRFVKHSKNDGRMPNSYGIAIDAPENTGDQFSAYKVSDAWLYFQGEYAGFLAGDRESPEVIGEYTDSEGTFATVRDENLALVNTLQGFIAPIEYEDGTVEEFFMVVADDEAFPTDEEDVYLAPAWDQFWFTVEYDPQAPTAWIPAYFSHSYEEDGLEHRVLTAEIDYYQAERDYSGRDVQPALATMSLILRHNGEDWEIWDHYIETYKILFSGPDDEEGYVQFDKASYQLAPGDRVEFWNFGFSLEDAANDSWFPTGDGVVTFVQEPVFLWEFLEFTDEWDEPFDYYYAIWAEDASGNPTLSDLIPSERVVDSPAPTPTPLPTGDDVGRYVQECTEATASLTPVLGGDEPPTEDVTWGELAEISGVVAAAYSQLAPPTILQEHHEFNLWAIEAMRDHALTRPSGDSFTEEYVTAASEVILPAQSEIEADSTMTDEEKEQALQEVILEWLAEVFGWELAEASWAVGEARASLSPGILATLDESGCLSLAPSFGSEAEDEQETTPTPDRSQDDHGSDIEAATAIEVETTVGGIVDYEGDTDYFRFTVAAGRYYQIDVALGTLDDSVATLQHGLLPHTAGWWELRFSDFHRDSRAFHIVWAAPDSGDSYVEVSGSDGSTGSYNLTITSLSDIEDDHGYNMDSATAIAVGADTQGSLDYGFDVDYFRFTATAGQIYQIDVASGTLAYSLVTLHDPNGGLGTFGNNPGESGASRIVWEAPDSGDYYVEVSGWDSTGSYTLSISLSDIPDDQGNDTGSATTPDPVGTPGEVIGRIVPELMRKWHIPGGGVAIVRDGKLVMAREYGLADVEGKEPVRPDSLFRIASISKPVTAVAILKLVQEGRLDLDDRVLQIIDQFLPNEEEIEDPRIYDITVRQSLQHSGGWKSNGFDSLYAFNCGEEDPCVSRPVSPEDIIRTKLREPLDFDPGTQYAYSNFGYYILGRVIEAVTGLSYEEYVRSEILGPVGITRMRIGNASAESREAGEARYYSYGYPDEQLVHSVITGTPSHLPAPYSFDPETLDADGGWIASPIDLVRLVSALDASRPPTILDPEIVELMTARPELEHLQDQPEHYGMGWNIYSEGDEADWWHDGSLPGTTSILVRTRDGTSWAALFNSDPGDDKVRQLADELDTLLHRAVNEVTHWPSGDLFPQYGYE